MLNMKRLTAFDVFMMASISCLPLQKAFTLDVGFPLKASELFLMAAVVIRLASARRVERVPIVMRLSKLLTSLLVVVAFSSIAALAKGSPSGDFQGYSRSVNVDTLLYVMYAIVVVLLWRSAIILNLDRFVKALSISVLVAALACILQYTLWQTGSSEVLKALGFEEVLGSAYGTVIPRNGSFMEGNYLGFFGGACLLVMIKYRRLFGVLSSLISVFYSQSTNVILSLIVAAVLSLLLRPETRRQLQAGLLSVLIVVVVLLVPMSRVFLSFQASKLGIRGLVSADGELTEGVDDSIDIRWAKISTAVHMFAENPILGVGPGRFGVWFDSFANPSLFPPDFFYKTGRRIVENSYMQILAEIGIFAFCIFIIFLVRFGFAIRRKGGLNFVLYLFLIISLNTAPSWTSLTIWVILGYLGSTLMAQRSSVNVFGKISIVGQTSKL